MKIFKFFVSKIFLRKIILGIGIVLLICISNYITFTAARTIISTFQGYQEIKELNQEGNFILRTEIGFVQQSLDRMYQKLRC